LSEEIVEVVRGRLLKDGVYVSDGEAAAELERRGYGDVEGKRLRLRDYEALFLLYIGRLEVYKGGEKFSLDRLAEEALKRDPDAWTKFLIYRDLRSRGYVVKEGFGFEIDFRVYDRGDFKLKPAKRVVFGLDEGKKLPIERLVASMDEITRMGKEPVVAVIERRGEVIYYKISRMRFEKLDRAERL